MGRKTWLSLPKRPLPNRLNVVLTKNPKKCSEGCVMVDSIEAALEICSQAKECFIIGGETVYRQMMPLADRLYVTRINKSFEADTFFPEISPEHWKLTYLSEWKEMDDKSFSYRFEIWDKKED
jgi:dihydrofolate reductase